MSRTRLTHLRPKAFDLLASGAAPAHGFTFNLLCATTVDKELKEKTQRLLHEQTTLNNLAPPGAIHELGPAELAALKGSDASAGTKVLNLARVLATVTDAEGATKPFLFFTSERAEAVRQSYEG